MEEVACAGGVGDADFVGGRIPEAMAIPGEGAVDPQRRADGAAPIGSFEKRKRFEELPLAGSGAGQIPGGDWVIDEREQFRKSRGPVVEIGNYRDICCARPGGRFARGGRVVSINIEKPRGVDPTPLEKGRGNGEARIAAPDDGAFTRLRFNENEGHLAKCFGRAYEMESDAFTPKVAAMEFRQVVVADTADVASAQSPALAGNRRGGDLAAEQNLRMESFDLRAEGGELSHLQNGIGGVFSDCQDVEFLRSHRPMCRVTEERENAKRVQD